MIIDKTGAVHDTPSAINKSLQYCIDLLSNKPPSHKYKEVVIYKVKLHDERMIESIENYLDEVSPEPFDKALKKLIKTDFCLSSS